jgi:hypothetical protein
MKNESETEDTFLKLLVDWISKNSEAQKAKDTKPVKKSVQKAKNISLEEAVFTMSETLVKCIQEVAKITASLTATVKVVNDHTLMIEEIYAVQQVLLNLQKTGLDSSSTVDDKKIVDTKKKTEKPN